jgi:hypothetical protein
MLVPWLDKLTHIESVADRNEFLKGVTGYTGSDAKTLVTLGLVAATLLVGRKK